jgi:Zn-dependent protease with chaperone function
MPLLVLLFLTAACLPEARAYSLFDWPTGTRLGLTAGLTSVGIVAAAVLGFATLRSVRRSPGNRAAAIRRYASVRWALFFVNVGLAILSIAVVGWGQVVEGAFRVEWRGEGVLAPFAELLVPAPYLCVVAANWFLYWPVERALSRTSGKPGGEEFWSLPGFVLFNARQFALMVMLPVVLFAGMNTAMRFAPEWIDDGVSQLVSIGAMVAFFVLVPRFVKPLLGLKSLPAGPHRDQLEAIERRWNFRRTDLLLWPTRGGPANAMILGVVPQARYVIFTDTLLESLTPPELEAVFGHEIGHARHGHLAYYALFLLMSAMALGGLAAVAHEWAVGYGLPERIPEGANILLKLGPFLMMGTYLFIVFGWLSRVCERQADIAGARTGSCRDPHCSGHDSDLPPPSPGGRGVGGEGVYPTVPCETGLRAMVMALEAVTGMNGTDAAGRRSVSARWLAWFRSWQHGPPHARIEYLQSLMIHPERAADHERYAYRVRWGLALALAAAVAASASYLGWNDMVKRW